MIKRQTKYLHEAVTVKSYIDFSGEDYQELTLTEWQDGKVSSIDQFWAVNNKQDFDLDSLPVFLIPKTLSQGISGLEIEKNFPFGILYVPAVLSKSGELTPPQNRQKAPWIPRDVLFPFNLQKTAIGKWEKYPKEYFKEKDYESWASYSTAIKTFYEQVLGVAWDTLTLSNHVPGENVPLEVGNVTYMILDQTVEAKKAICNLYEKLEEEDIPALPLYQKLILGESRSEETPCPVTSIACMKEHVGQMGGAYPLSVSQRESINHFHALSEGEVLAVSGPPGTGKTTLLQSIVADMFVSRALSKLLPPVIVATSTNNQAVTNVIDSFGKIPVIGIEEMLEKRWVTKADSFAAYFPSNYALQKVQRKGYLCTDRLGGGSVEEIESEENREAALKLFLQNSSSYFRQSFTEKDIKRVISLIHERLVRFAEVKNTVLEALRKIQCMTGGVPYLSYQKELEQQIKVCQVEVKKWNSELAIHREKVKLCEQRFFEWQQYYVSIPWYIRFFSHFVRIFKTEVENRLRIYMTLDEIEFWRGKVVNLRDVQQYYLQEKEHISAICLQLEKNVKAASDKEQEYRQKKEQLEHKVKILVDFFDTLKDRLAIDIFYTPPQENKEEWQKIFARKKKYVEEADVQGINELLDTTVRYLSFWLAVHYYEAEWLLDKCKLTERQQVCSYRDVQEKRFRRMAMLTPCMVMTFFKLPSMFTTQRSNEEPASYLFNYIDLLIVDEAGQVSPEVALPAFALAKKALVVGDEEQIPPVWEVKVDMDVTLACEKGIIQNNQEYALLQKSGLNCAESSIMRLAAQACRFQKDGYRGMFLCEHRRCYDEIIDFCNKLVYKGRLKPYRGCLLEDKKSHLKSVFPAMGHYSIEVPASEKRGSSRYNSVEAEQIVRWINLHTAMLLEAYPDDGRIEKIIGIITPFKAQVATIKHVLPDHLKKIRVGTIHTFQGAECRVIILSTVYGGNDGCYFIENNKSLMNVAVSRAKDFFFVFGSRKCLSTNGTSGLLRKMTEIEIVG